MRHRFSILFFVALPFLARTQQFSGQWEGEFIDKSSARGSFAGDKCKYVLELDVKGDKAIGSSYTYFTEGGKRYYTICKVEGTIDNKKKYIEVKEVERTKTNIPQHIRNCFQIHQLTYFKQGTNETMEGKWIPAPNQNNCGFGNTQLTRRTLVNAYPNAYAKLKKDPNPGTPERSNPVTKNNTNPTVNHTASIPKPTKPKTTPSVELEKRNDEIVKQSEKITPIDTADIAVKPEMISIEKLEKRKNTVLKSIEVESDVVNVDLYDNGEIDGDSISLFYNNKLLLADRRLTDKAISIKLPMADDDSVNELVMYAENLGLIPPNTALMVVRDGPNRYEVRISSDLEKNGVIRFVHKKRKAP
jgi:hypothetical protein